MSKSFLLFALTATTFVSSAMAQGTAAVTSGPTATVSSTFPPQTDTENTGAISGGAGASGGQESGNEGPTQGAFTLGKGAIIGISVTAGIIIVGIGKFLNALIVDLSLIKVSHSVGTLVHSQARTHHHERTA
jgi:hypothetical protein